MKLAKALLREAVVSAISQPSTTLITLAVMASMVASILLTSGKEVGAEDQVLSSINDQGARSIIVTAQPGSGLGSGVVNRVELIHGVSWVAGFGDSRDYVNSAVAGSNPVGVRDAYGSDLAVIGVPRDRAVGDFAYGTRSAIRAFNLADGTGSISPVEGGPQLTALGGLSSSSSLSFLQPLVIVPKSIRGKAPVAVVVVVVASPIDIDPVARAVTTLLAVSDPSKVEVTTSGSLARLHSIVANQLGGLQSTLTALLFVLSAALVTALMYSVVTIRRKDFGRRRALGASRILIVALLVSQTTITSVVGALIGLMTSAVILEIGHDALPSVGYFSSVVLLAVFVGSLAGIVPGLIAARRDPLQELRVP